ncbi:MAG: type I DNA topoisomerase [Candidatus Melainabacteria bacterium]|nr:MAG: type I DNA topoisomerase [Candidatus Melainabacteria bacterium]
MPRTATKEKKETKAKTSTKKSAEKEGKALVIVESPAKSKTIKKILGDNYTIEASFGHIRDFPKNVLGFDVTKNFEPSFVVIPEKKKVVDKLNEIAKKCAKVYLASDPDREGEAIAWHVRQVLKVDDDKIQRIEFNEITPKAVKYAVEHPREIDIDRVKAQQTRQILDRLVGYKISPVLWEKLRNNHLSAGRVQSVALRMICEREDEIEAFKPVEYWTISAELQKENATFEAELQKYLDKKIELKNEDDSNKAVEYLNDKSTKFIVDKISKRETTRKPSPPFITSTLQREASSKLGYGVAKTMQIAQKLYEGIELGSDGAVGLITYMRTDSVRISDDAQVAAKEFIVENYGEKYYPETPNDYVKAGKKNVQDAHEAIRPSYPSRTPQSIKSYLTSEQYRLYKLIWDRFMSSQMQNASIANTSIDIKAGDYTFKAGTSSIIFDGFLKLYSEEDDDAKKSIPEMKKGDVLKRNKINPKQHFTQPPPRYSEASLVKALEEHGIGRPSTYAPIITKIQTKGYVEKIEKALAPTLLGRTVSKQLVEHFKEVMDYDFTAGMENQLDEIADKKAKSEKVLKDFYDPFVKIVAAAKQNMERINIESDIKCPNCGKPMVVRTSRFGSQFLGCSGYPECKTMMPLNATQESAQQEPEVCEEKCEKCGSDMIYKVGPYGKYMECTNADCKNRKRVVISTGVKCPKCGGEIVQRKSKYGKIFYGCNKYPDCDFVLWNEPTGDVCPDCGSLLVKKVLKKGTFIECSSKTCKYSKELENV